MLKILRRGNIKSSIHQKEKIKNEELLKYRYSYY